MALVFQVEPASADHDYVYRVIKGDTLIGLSARLLNSPDDWPKVARHNRLPNANYILPDAELRIPFALLKSTSTAATVTHVQGDVKAATGAGARSSVLVLGAALAEGATVVTGKDGYATLKLPDGSTVRVQSATEVQVERMRTYPEVGLLESAMKVIAGRVESLVQKFRPEEKKQTRHDVKTPLANLAVRGTEFRVTMDPQSRETRGEVLDGAVAVAADGATSEKRLGAGFGSVVDANKSVSDPIALLVAPNVAELAKLQERTILRFPLSIVAGASRYRAQVARDEAFSAVVAELVSASPELRLTNIDDGSYFLRVRAVDSRGLEGRDATHAFTLKARPEPPLITAPPPKGKVRATEVEFKWAQNTEAAVYHLQIAKDATFKSLVFENKAIIGAQSEAVKLAAGDYFWRVASLRKDGDRGPYGDAASFALLPPPAQPEPPLIGDSSIQFRWGGEPGQTFEFQLASDIKFAKSILSRTLDKPIFEVPRPAPGTYFIRIRATDPDGFVGPYSAAQTFTVVACLTDSEGRCVSASHGIVSPL
ncbi:MAG TPA: FecR domain-containing protein [Burkholderiales bacterium]|nr:FecR domain-containing protein [Burkholderiales bacterium]